MEKENLSLDLQTIRATIAGEAWAVEKVAEHYSDEIDRCCTIAKRQLDGSVKKVIDQNMRQSLVMKLIESPPQFEVEL